MKNFTRVTFRLVIWAIVCLASINMNAQTPNSIGTDLANGTYTNVATANYGLFNQYRVMATVSVASGTRKLEFPENVGSFYNVWRTYSGGTLSAYNTMIDPVTQAASARWNNNFQGTGIMLPAITSGNYYTVNIMTNNGYNNDTMAVLETTYNPITITAVSIPIDTNTVGPFCSPTIIATLSAAPSAGEYVYLRYSTTGFLDSSVVVPMTVIGTTATAQIPAYPNGTHVDYYVLTSPIASLITTGPGSGYYDCLTLNLKNGSIGNNFRYNVKNIPTPSVSIAASLNPVCSGVSDLFTAHGVNNGTVASDYHWYKNGIAVGTNDSIYSDATLVNGDSVWVLMTANLGCPVVDTSNHIVVAVNPTPVLTQPSDQGPFCNGTFTNLVGFVFAPAGTTINWTNTNASIGLIASGSGDISSFQVFNNGNTTAVANISATPSTAFCAGSPRNFSYQVYATVRDTQRLAYCYGGSVTVGAKTHTATGNYNDTLTASSIHGCDSVVTTLLTIYPLDTFSQTKVLCSGQSIKVGNATHNATGTYIDTLTAADVHSCDSIVTTHLTVNPLSTYTQFDTICQGGSFIENGHTYTTTNTYIDTFFNSSMYGCDSIVTTHLKVNPLSAYTQFDTICQGGSFIENGHTYTTTNTYIDTFSGASVYGCDSIVTTHLTVNIPPAISTNPTDQTVSAGNTATFTAAATGTPVPTVQWQVSTDGGTTFNNVPGATATTLSVPSTTLAMNGYEYQAVFTNSCNSATTTAAILTVNPALAVTTDPTDQTVCDNTTATFTAAATSTPAPTVQWQVSTNGGISFNNIPGATSPTLSFTASFSENGYQYWAIFTNGATSDTTTKATLTVKPVATYTQNPSICQGNSFVENGHSYTTTNTYTDTFYNAAVNGCDSIVITNLTVNPTPIVALGAPVSQCAGNVQINAGNPGSTFLWSDGNTNQIDTASASGVYYVTVTNSFACKDTASKIVYIKPIPLVNLGPAQNLCTGSTMLDAGNPGDTYVWTGGSTGEYLTVTATGTYTVTVTDTASQCSVSGSVLVTFGSMPSVNLGNDTAMCGGSLTLMAKSANSTYIWSNGDTTSQISVNTTGNYSVTVTSAGDCVATGSILVTFYPKPNLGADITDSICPASRANLYNYYVNSGLTLTYSTPTPASVDTGTYTVIGTNSNGCTDTALITITYRQKPNAGGNKTDSICPGSTYDLTVLYPNVGFTSYTWNTPTPTAVNIGTYRLVVTNASGCTDTAIATISARAKPNLGGNKTDSICPGYTYDLTTLYPASGYATYTWVGVANYFAVTTGTYELIVTNASGCSDTAYATIIDKIVPKVYIPAYPNLCSTNPAFPLTGATPSGGVYYVDYVLDSIFRTSTLGAGIHHVTYVFTTAGGCADSASHDVTIYPKPQIIDTLGLPTSCTGSQPINLNNYFSPAGGQFSGVGISGYYFYPSLVQVGSDSITYIYTDQNGCMDTAGRKIDILASVKVSLHTTQSNLTICKGQPITFTATGAVDYQFFVNDSAWTTLDTTNTFTTSALSNHDEVKVYGTNGCSSDTSDFTIIDVIPLPTVTVGPDTTIDLGQIVQLHSNASGATTLVYFWSPDSFLNVTNIPNPVYSGPDTIIFQLKVTDTYGCSATAYDTINVRIPDNVLLPNVITPNGDGKNDVWALNPKINLIGSHLVIFNRWGEVVYETDNYNNDWGGTYKSTGHKVPDGTYYYVLTVPAQDNHTYKGPINVLSSEGN